jgi:Leucine-rich repeat (LRR) protein
MIKQGTDYFHLTKLEELWLFRNQITDLTPLAELTELRKLIAEVEERNGIKL